MAMMLGGQGSISSEINVTSLIDVLLVLLIIFMVLQRPSYGERAEIPQPPDKTQALPPQPKDIIIQLQETAGGQRPALKINEDAVSWQDLEARLMKIYSARAEKVAFLKGDPEIDFQYVAEVIDVTHHAGVTHVGLLGN